jgi:hypothetical protein
MKLISPQANTNAAATNFDFAARLKWLHDHIQETKSESSDMFFFVVFLMPVERSRLMRPCPTLHCLSAVRLRLGPSRFDAVFVWW